MCGFVVAIARPGTIDRESFELALASLRHRGPDSVGIKRKIVDDWEIWLGHQRLAIQDLDPRANQPMSAGDLTLLYNGEIYNAPELRASLSARKWLSSSDTEVLLATLQERGTRALHDVNGMFSFAAFDGKARTLTLARDRLGQKPLYLHHSSERLLAASEPKALYPLMRHCEQHLTTNARALAHFRWLGYMPFAFTPFNEIEKFRAASWARFHLQPGLDGEIKLDEQGCYWDPFAQVATASPYSFAAARDACSSLIDEATAMRTVSDRPVGVFLSGGIDSNLVASSLARSKKDVVAISVESQGFDESVEAEKNAHLLGLPFRRIRLSQSSYDRQLEKLPDIFDEPFADQSAIPLMALCEESVAHVTVALTGDGGDEPFVGYPWHVFPERIWQSRVAQLVRRAPLRLGTRQRLARLAGSAAGAAAVNLLERAVGRNPDTANAKAILVEELLLADKPSQLYDVLHSAQPPSTLERTDSSLLMRPLLDAAKDFYPEYSWEALSARPLCEQLAGLDLVTYLRDGVLVKADRSSMAYSLELRSPFLDHRLVEFGFSLPLEYKVRAGQSKALLREILKTRMGPKIAGRGKSGFGVKLPSGLPPARTERGRWVKQCEQTWMKRWPSDTRFGFKSKTDLSKVPTGTPSNSE